jgi:hypothetical protein
MASSDYRCSIRQGYNFERDQQVAVGHLVKMKIGTKELAQDTTLTGPDTLKNDVKVVGVMSGMSWKGGYADPLYINCNISTTNQSNVLVLKHTTLVETEVEFNFNIFTFDPIKKKYYKCFHDNGTAMKGLILKQGNDLLMDVAENNDPTVQSPLNYNFVIAIMPSEADAQTIHMAVSETDKFTKVWGVKCTGA